jgi:serine/threonine protein kinase
MKNAMNIGSAEERATMTVQPTRQSFCHEGSTMRASGTENKGAPSNFPASFPMSNELQVGQVLDERFKILDVINRGGMAWIYKALDRQTGRIVALKVPLMQFESDPGFYSRFQREENIGLTLEHPCTVYIVPVPAADKSRPYIAMEYLEGQTLATRLRETARLSEGEAVRIVIGMCDGLSYLHRKGVVHRDLKPENVMLCPDGSIRIMDFGIAKSENVRRLTFGAFSSAMGTPDYIAPEQVQGKRGDARTDIYALGAMLYEMTTGFPSYDGDNPYVVMNARLTGDPEAPRKRNRQLSPEIEEIILHALERNPSKRFPSADSMRKELNDYSEVHLTERSKRLRSPQLWKARFPLLPMIAVLAALQIAVFFLLFWLLSRSSHHTHSTVTSPPGLVDGQPQGK